MAFLPAKKLILKSTATLLAVSSAFLSSNAMANSCSKADIDFYLQKGFTNEQVVQLCTAATNAPAQIQTAVQQGYHQAPAAQYNPIREDQVYLEAALNASDVKLSSQSLSFNARECIEYGHPNVPDAGSTACATSNIVVDFQGLKVKKTVKGFILIKDAGVVIKGNIKRNFIELGRERRQDREAIRETLSGSPKEFSIPVRRGIDPNQVAKRLQKYVK